MARHTIVHKNKRSSKLPRLEDNEESDDLVQTPLAIHSPHIKYVPCQYVHLSRYQTDHQTVPSPLYVVFYQQQSTNLSPDCPQFQDDHR